MSKNASYLGDEWLLILFDTNSPFQKYMAQLVTYCEDVSDLLIAPVVFPGADKPLTVLFY